MNFKYIDIGVLSLLTVGFFLAYIIYAIIYFVKFDKNVKLDSSGNTHGLSRICLCGIFFLFGLLIFDLICEFGQIYINKYMDYKPVVERTISSTMMAKCFTFFILFNKYQLLPLEVFINGLFAVSFFYIGVEGLIASLKTLNIESGLRIELPAKKRTRLANIFYIWCFLSLVTTIYTILLGSDEVNFYNKNCVFCTIATLIVVILSERSPQLLENATIIKSKDSSKVDCNIVKQDMTVKEAINSINTIATNIANGTATVVVNDKNDETDLSKIVPNTTEDIGK